MTRWWIILVACLALAGAGLVLIALHPWWVPFAIGVHPYPAGTPWTYQLWSGFVPAMTVITLFTGMFAHFKLVNCHVHRCLRIGRYPMAGGQFRVCGVHSHHPRRVTHEYILRAHDEHMAAVRHAPGS